MKLVILQITFITTLLFLCNVKADTTDNSAINKRIELNRIVAIVNNDVITQDELSTELETISKQLEQQRIQRPPEAILKKQVLERLVVAHLQLQLADKSNIKVDDNTLNKTISNIAEQNGLSLGEFRDVLEQDGYNFKQFRNDIREEIIINRLRQRQVESRIVVTEQEIDNFIKKQSTEGGLDNEYHLGHILIAIPESASPDQIEIARKKANEVMDLLHKGNDFSQTAITHSDGQQALEGGDMGWRKSGELPTIFASALHDMAVGETSGIIRSPSGFHIIKLIDHRGSKQRMITQTHARHILIKTNEITSDDEARSKLLELKARIENNNEDFADLARQYSEDKGSAINGGDLGWASPGMMVPEFEKVMVKTDPDKVSKPFKTQFGWHLIQVLEQRSHDATEELKRAKIREAIFKRKAEEEYLSWLRRLRDEAYVEFLGNQV